MQCTYIAGAEQVQPLVSTTLSCMTLPDLARVGPTLSSSCCHCHYERARGIDEDLVHNNVTCKPS